MGAPIIRYEAGQTAYPFEAMTDSGDHAVFEASFSPISNAAGAEPKVAPYGLLTGGAITPAVTNNVVNVAALTASMAGVSGADADGVVSVAGGTATITRPTGNVAKVNSITIDSTGAIAVVAGTDGASATFSETRGAAGGPPLIPVGSIEIGQVRVTTSAAGPVTAGQIYAVNGLHVERADYPVYALNFATGEVTFNDPLPLIHTGNVPKKVYIRGAVPVIRAHPQNQRLGAGGIDLLDQLHPDLRRPGRLGVELARPGLFLGRARRRHHRQLAGPEGQEHLVRVPPRSRQERAAPAHAGHPRRVAHQPGRRRQPYRVMHHHARG